MGPLRYQVPGLNFGTPLVVGRYGALEGQALQLDLTGNAPQYFYDQIQFTLPKSTSVHWLHFDVETKRVVGSTSQLTVHFDVPEVRSIIWESSGALRLVAAHPEGGYTDQTIATFVDEKRYRMSIAFDVAAQRMFIFRDGAALGEFPVSSGSGWIQSIRFSFGVRSILDWPDYATSVGLDNIMVTTSTSVTPSDARITNTSIRAKITSDNPLVFGTYIHGGTRGMMVRAAGPALKAFGVQATVPDPSLAIYAATEQLSSNDDWDASLGSLFDATGAFAFGLGSKDAALRDNNMGGPVTVHGRSSAPGILLVEAYDLGTGIGRIANVSARGEVGRGDDILIAGVAVEGRTPIRVLIRAVGPRLAAYGVGGYLADPVLSVYRGTQLIAEVDDADPALNLIAREVAAFPLVNDTRSAAMLLELEPNATYTVHARGKGDTTGIALIELYEVR